MTSIPSQRVYKVEISYQKEGDHVFVYHPIAGSDTEAHEKAMTEFRARGAEGTVITVSITPVQVNSTPETREDSPVDAASEEQARAISIPEIRAAVSDDEMVVELAFAACRECPEQSTPVRTDSGNEAEAPVYDWVQAHREATGHTRFYRWGLTRNTMRAFQL